MSNIIQLNQTCILSVPLQAYDKDFLFIVNGEEFKTSRLISHLLSPIICQIHSSDPTIDTLTINTCNHGNFSSILNLVNFNPVSIPENEFPFFLEVLKILGNKSIDFLQQCGIKNITVDNIFSIFEDHVKYDSFNSKLFDREIDFMSSHFFELCESHKEEFLKLPVECLYHVISSAKLRLKSEDQLLRFINEFYIKDTVYSILYECVCFTNISSKAMKEFIEAFDFNDLTSETWIHLSNRLEKDIKKLENYSLEKNERYTEKVKESKTFAPSDEGVFCGILNYLRKSAQNNFSSVVNITSSSCSGGDCCQPQNVTIYDDPNRFFNSSSQVSNWIEFDFLDKNVIPTEYTLKSIAWNQNLWHPKSWVIEGSNNKKSWDLLDKREDCPYLNGSGLIHTFKIENQKSNEYRYIRMKSTGPDWSGGYLLSFEAFELYGKLIKKET